VKAKKWLCVILSLSAALLVVGSGAAVNDGADNQTIPAETEVTNVSSEAISFMFVQEAESGTFIESANNTYILTLLNVNPYTIYFSDRPYLIAGSVPMQLFLDGFNWGPENPPNAAVVLRDANESEDVVIVQLTDPHYDEDNATLAYTATILENYTGDGLAYYTPKGDEAIPEAFSAVAVFIDGCPDVTINCGSTSTGNSILCKICGTARVGQWWDWLTGKCYTLCDNNSLVCNKQFPDCCGGQCCEDIQCCDPNCVSP
jgi:hypothetical protein